MEYKKGRKQQCQEQKKDQQRHRNCKRLIQQFFDNKIDRFDTAEDPVQIEQIHSKGADHSHAKQTVILMTQLITDFLQGPTKNLPQRRMTEVSGPGKRRDQAAYLDHIQKQRKNGHDQYKKHRPRMEKKLPCVSQCQIAVSGSVQTEL